MVNKLKKTFFTRHAKSSAMVVSLAIHAVLLVIALSYVAVTVIRKDDQKFESRQVVRPKMELKKLQVPVKIKKKRPKPRLRKNITVKTRMDRNMPDIKMPELVGIKGGLGSIGNNGGVSGIGFSMPEMDFFGAKAKGEKVIFIVHFGPATVSEWSNKKTISIPFTRMTGYTIRKRLEELVSDLPEYTLFNVTAFYASLCTPFSENMMPATAQNKILLLDWMEPVNPVEGSSKVYGESFNGPFNTRLRKLGWPNRLDENIPSYGPKWYYDYRTKGKLDDEYLPDSDTGFIHWSRALTWALQTQKPDTIFILTTNYISDDPSKMVGAYRKMLHDIYGLDRKKYPTVNVVVLTKAGKDSKDAHTTLNDKFGPIIKLFKGDGSVIDDITKYMTDEEKDRLKSYSKPN